MVDFQHLHLGVGQMEEAAPPGPTLYGKEHLLLAVRVGAGGLEGFTTQPLQQSWSLTLLKHLCRASIRPHLYALQAPPFNCASNCQRLQCYRCTIGWPNRTPHRVQRVVLHP